MRLGRITPWVESGLLLRAFKESDICLEYLRTLNDADYMRFSRQGLVAHDRHTAFAYLTELERTGGVMIAGFAEATRNLVATVTIRPGPTSGAVEMGLLTLQPFQRQGVGRTTWQACLTYLKSRESRVNEVLAGTHKDNVGMQRILLESGFARIAEPSGEAGNHGLNIFFKRVLRSLGPSDVLVAE